MFRFLHMADVHLDTAFQNRDSEMRAYLRDSVREAFRAGVDLALSSGCHALLIAGDLFDNQTLSFATERFLLKEMSRLEEGDVKVFYAPGNHDPSGITYRASNIRWPSNVHVFARREPEAIPITDNEGNTRAVIVGAGHEGNRESENLARLFPTADNDVPHIGLLHALVTGSRGDTNHERYAPCTLDDFKGKGYKYWALGHIHIREVMSEDPYVVYSGNLLGRNPREVGSKGAYLVEIHDNKILKADFHHLAPLSWANLTVDNLDGTDNFERLQGLVTESVQESLEKNNLPGRIFLRLNLKGPCPLYQELNNKENIETLIEGLALALNLEYLEIKSDNLIPPINPNKYRDEPHILSTLLSILDSIKIEGEMLLELAPEELAGFYKKGDRKGKIQYLQSLLRGMDYEAVTRLVEVDRL